MTKLLRIASYLSIASVCWSGGILFSATVSMWVFLFFSVSAGILLTAVAMLEFAQAQRDMNRIDALEKRAIIVERWAQMLASAQLGMGIIEQIQLSEVEKLNKSIH